MIHIGPVELAAVGVSIAIFNQVSKIAIFPLVSVTTSFVAEDDVAGSLSDKAHDIEITETSSAVNDEKEELIPKAGMFFFPPIHLRTTAYANKLLSYRKSI